MSSIGRLQSLVLLVAPAVAWGVDANQAEVVYDGLYNPRHVAVNDAGTVFVAESGRGGFRQGELTPSMEGGPICFGLTSRVSAIEGDRRMVVARLPSWTFRDADGACPSDGDFAIGASGVAVDDEGTVAFTVGFAGHPDDREALADVLPYAGLFGTAFNFYDAMYPAMLGDLADFERQDADQGGVDSNPYGVTIDDDGVSRLVVDAGANALVRVDPLLGPALVAVFAPQCVAWDEDQANPLPPEDNPCGSQTLFPAQSVPTDVTIGPDGAYYVSELGGFPFVTETSRIWRIEPNAFDVATCSTFEGTEARGCEVYATGLTSVVSLDFDEASDALFAVQIDDNGVGALEAGGGGFGSVQRIPAGGGEPTAVLERLVTPGGVDVSGGFLYVTQFSVYADVGEVVRIETDRLNAQ